MATGTRILHDSVHPHMEIPEICFAIINTLHFQRLKNLKQLATCHFVYPSASHNRYEHCIGVCHLAGEYGRILQKKQPELDISETDILCLQIAGLCHDLGHGPFSHSWERFVNSSLEPCSPKYKHEENSLLLFDHMVETNNLREKFRVNKPSLYDTDLEFIKSLMNGDKARKVDGQKVDVGRGPEKDFLYEIVANEISKVDVDKFDYLLRDCKLLNLTTAFDYRRVMTNSQVHRIEAAVRNGCMFKKHVYGIVYNKKVAGDLEDLFRGRLHMHQIAYQHKTNKIVEEMLLDGFKQADNTFHIPGEPKVKLSTAHKHPEVFIKLTDSIFEIIMNNWIGGVDEAAALFRRIAKGEYYKCLGCVTLNQTDSPKVLQLKIDLMKQLEIGGLTLLKTSSDYGAKSNPLNHQYFSDYDITGKGRISKEDFGTPPSEQKYYLVVKDSLKEKEVLAEVAKLVDKLGAGKLISGIPNPNFKKFQDV